MNWIMILFVHVGPFAEGNSVTLTNVPGFATEEQCRDAGKKSLGIVAGTVKSAAFVCVQGGKI